MPSFLDSLTGYFMPVFLQYHSDDTEVTHRLGTVVEKFNGVIQNIRVTQEYDEGTIVNIERCTLVVDTNTAGPCKGLENVQVKSRFEFDGNTWAPGSDEPEVFIRSEQFWTIELHRVLPTRRTYPDALNRGR